MLWRTYLAQPVVYLTIGACLLMLLGTLIYSVYWCSRPIVVVTRVDDFDDEHFEKKKGEEDEEEEHGSSDAPLDAKLRALENYAIDMSGRVKHNEDSTVFLDAHIQSVEELKQQMLDKHEQLLTDATEQVEKHLERAEEAERVYLDEQEHVVRQTFNRSRLEELGKDWAKWKK